MVKKIIKKFSATLLIAAILMSMMPTAALIVDASSLTGMSDTMDNQTISANSKHVIRYTASTPLNATSQAIIIVFPSGFNFGGKTISSLSFSHGPSTGLEHVETLTSTPGATTWGAAFSTTNNLTLTLTTPTSGIGAAAVATNDKVIITYDSTNSVNPSSATTYTINITSNTDTGSITVPILTNSQVAVTATVSQIFSFAISNNSIGFGTLTTANTRYATSDSVGATSEPINAHNITAGTNSASGYTVAISGATLTSGATTIAAIPGASAVALAAGTEQFGIRTAASGGTGVVSAPFNGAAGNYGFGTAPLSNQTFATAAGPSTTTTYNVNYAANIATLTPAGNYTTTLTYVATANF
ncbi:MAG: hypothetical protein JWM92_272 [Candidatus Nomurabacteria bacterium]|nr:hypothetical protein [Candidatus Nomurabacteria bacterium]